MRTLKIKTKPKLVSGALINQGLQTAAGLSSYINPAPQQQSLQGNKFSSTTKYRNTLADYQKGKNELMIDQGKKQQTEQTAQGVAGALQTAGTIAAASGGGAALSTTTGLALDASISGASGGLSSVLGPVGLIAAAGTAAHTIVDNVASKDQYGRVKNANLEAYGEALDPLGSMTGGIAAAIEGDWKKGGEEFVSTLLPGLAGVFSKRDNKEMEESTKGLDLQRNNLNTMKVNDNLLSMSSRSGYGLAKAGLEAQDNMPVEVEGGELRLRRGMKGYEVVNDFKGPKHEGGGIDVDVKDGDIIIPAHKRNEVLTHIQARRHDLIDKVVETLPEVTSTSGRLDNGAVANLWNLNTSSPTMNIPEQFKSNGITSVADPYNLGSDNGRAEYFDNTKSLVKDLGLYSEGLANNILNKNKINYPRTDIPNTNYKPVADNQPSWLSKAGTAIGGVAKGIGEDIRDNPALISTIGKGIYATAGLIGSMSRPAPGSGITPLSLPNAPDVVANRKLPSNILSTEQAMSDDVHEGFTTAVSKLKELGMNPVAAATALQGQQQKGMSDVRTKLADMQRQLVAAETQLNTGIDQMNSQQKAQWTNSIAQMKYDYERYKEQVIMNENANISKERAGLWQMALNMPAEYQSVNDPRYSAEEWLKRMQVNK